MSNISPKYAAIIQSEFYQLTFDDYSPRGLFGTIPFLRNFSSEWQYVVDIIYRCLKVGYWNLWNEGWMKARQLRNYEDFCSKLSQFNPDKISGEGAVYWLQPLVYASDLGEQLVEKYNLAPLEDYEEGKDGFVCKPNFVCKPFIDEIERTFAENNIPWGEKIFPVRA